MEHPRARAVNAVQSQGRRADADPDGAMRSAANRPIGDSLAAPDVTREPLSSLVEVSAEWLGARGPERTEHLPRR
jgi:hypothetical protein